MTILKTTKVQNLKQLTFMLYELYLNVKKKYKYKRLQETGKLGAMSGIIFLALIATVMYYIVYYIEKLVIKD